MGSTRNNSNHDSNSNSNSNSSNSSNKRNSATRRRDARVQSTASHECFHTPVSPRPRASRYAPPPDATMRSVSACTAAARDTGTHMTSRIWVSCDALSATALGSVTAAWNRNDQEEWE